MKKLISLIVVVSMLAAMFVCMPVANAFNTDNDNAPQLVDQNSAYVIFGSTNQTSGLTVSGRTTQVTYGGVTGAQLAANQTLTFALGSGKTASKYVVVVKYYDPGVNVEEFTIAGRKIRKTGMQAKWVTESFVLESNATSFAVTSSNALVLSKIEFVKYSGTASAGDIANIDRQSKSSNNRTYYYINSDNPLILPYVTEQCWNYQGTKFIFKTLNNGQYSLYEYDIVNEKATKLDTGLNSDDDVLSAQVTYDNKIYYAKADGTTWKMDWLTYKTEKQANAKAFYSPSVTNDGQWMTGVLKNWGNENRQLLLENTITGEAKAVSISDARSSWPSGSYASHPQVNPEYPHLVSVAHDNDESSVVHNRIWLSNFNTDTTYNMFVQVPNSDSTTGEPSGHEIWSADGESMYWVKFDSAKVGQYGIMRTDKYGMTREYINGDFPYWHCFPSADDNFVVADSNPSGSTDGIVVVNLNTYKSTKIADFTNKGSSHPDQPHPRISGNNFSVNWQFKPGNVLWSTAETSIGWAVVRDVTKDPAPTNRYSAGTGVELITCSDAVSATTDYTTGGVAYKQAASGKGLYFDISSDVCMSTNADVTLEISYLDKGSNPLVITYTNGVDEVNDLVVREDATYNITKSNSQTLKTATVTLNDINVNNAGKFRSDFYISCSDGAYISGVNASCTNPGSEKYCDMISSYPAEFGAENSNGLEIRGTSSSYNANLWHVNNKEGWTSDGIDQSGVDKAKNNGCNYVAKNKDGAWSYRKVSDKDGVEKTVYFTSKNNRADKGWIVNGSLYFNVRGDVITESDNNVTFDITYLDFATDTNITVEYTASDDDGKGSFTIAGTGTGKWKTASVTISDAKMSSTNSGTPFALNTEDIKVSYGGDMYIASVCISKPQLAADSDLYVQNMYYSSKDVVVKTGNRVVASADNNTTSAGIVATGLENNANYDSTLYHVDDTTAWTNAGFTQSDITTAKNAGCNYVTLNKDGAWMYKEFTDSQGVTKNTFYAPFNWRKSNGSSELSNIYFRLTNDTIAYSDAAIVIAVEYLDNGGTLDVTYVSRTGRNTVKVVGTHTGKWKTAYITADDAAISANNSDTALALGSEDIKIATDQTPIASVTVMKQYNGDGSGYQVVGGNVYKSNIKVGDIATPNAVVTNKSASTVKANLYTIVYNSDKTMKSIEKGSAVTIGAGATAEISTPEVTLSSGETIESFVWDGTLTPVEKSVDPLGIVITPTNGSVKLSRNNSFYAGHFINIYSGGKLVGRTNGSYCILDNLNKGNNTLIVDVVDTYGKVVLRSKPIIANVK